MNFIELKSCSSTQDEALKFLLEKPQWNSVWVRSKQQTQGRGRQQHKWISPEGNLYLSGAFRIQDFEKSLHWPFMSLVAGWALCETLEAFGLWRKDFFLKWPNDLFCKQDQIYYKLAGILCELKSAFLVVGLGVNFKVAPLLDSHNKPYKSLSLDHLGKPLPSLTQFSQSVAEIFSKHLECFIEDSWQLRRKCTQELNSRWMRGFLLSYGIELSSGTQLQAMELLSDGKLRCRSLADGRLLDLASGEFQMGF
jgi:biotin-[acetyl-CoA-carboxylase] ligase BirA-like protein